MSKKFFVVISSLLVTLSSLSNVCAEEPIVIESKITALKEGELAPYQGVLLSPKAAAEVVVKLDSIDQKVKLEVDKCMAEREAQVSYLTAEYSSKMKQVTTDAAARLSAKDKEIKQLSDLAKAKESSMSPMTWATIGVVGGVIAGVAGTIAIAYAVK